MFAEFCGCLRIFAECLRNFAEFSRIFCGILRTNTKGTRAKGHQCEALIINGGVSPKNVERNNIGRVCAKLAGLARNRTNLLVIKRVVSP